MKIIKLDLDYLSGPIWGDVYSIELHKSITGIKIIDDDKILQDLHNQIQDLFLTYYDFDAEGQTCLFNKEKQQADKVKMLEMVNKLKLRLNEINDGSFEIEDLITSQYENI